MSVNPIIFKKRESWPLCPGRSDVLRPSFIPAEVEPRAFYLDQLQNTLPPYLARSAFISDLFVQNLMRNKKDSALACKFEEGATPPDQISDMEGALHTFITPIVVASLHGDYFYDDGHHMRSYKPQADGQQSARDVLLSAMVHPDFEDDRVMMRAIALKEHVVQGFDRPPDQAPLSTLLKQDRRKRVEYDAQLRRHLIFHLTRKRALPSRLDIASSALSVEEAISMLQRHTSRGNVGQIDFETCYIKTRNGTIISGEMLFRTALEQVQNEFTILEHVCPQGYVYTFDPPAIFAQALDARLLTRMHIAAISYFMQTNQLMHMRGYAFNCYADKHALPLIQTIFQSQSHVTVTAKDALFGDDGYYAPDKWAKGAMLVVHNNSDAFGQNIETETGCSSMDAAMGQYSSAAASLHRQRLDLLSRLV
jgi:hypothetical protein